MNKLLFIIGLYATTVSSQIIEKPIASIEYFTTINLHVEELYNCKLIYNQNESVFIWSKSGDESVKNSNGSFTKASHYDDQTINYINFKDKTLDSQKFIYGKEAVHIEEDLPSLNWNITNEKKMIGSFETVKATVDFRGRNFSVWFSPELGHRVGPWKLNGLPGTILEAYDQAREIVFSMHKINYKPTTLTFEITGEKVNLEEYYQKEINYPFEMIKRLQAKAGRGSGIKITAVNYNFLEKDYERLGKEVESKIEGN